jgi:hypothetical protein
MIPENREKIPQAEMILLRIISHTVHLVVLVLLLLKFIFRMDIVVPGYYYKRSLEDNSIVNKLHEYKEVVFRELVWYLLFVLRVSYSIFT